MERELRDMWDVRSDKTKYNNLLHEIRGQKQ